MCIADYELELVTFVFPLFYSHITVITSKPRCTGRVRQCFLVQELLTYGTIYLLTQQTLAVCARFAHQLVQDTCLDFVQFMLSDAITV